MVIAWAFQASGSMPSSAAMRRAISRCVSSPHVSSRSNHSSQPRPVRSRIRSSDVASHAPSGSSAASSIARAAV